jgi:hypothetical protein
MDYCFVDCIGWNSYYCGYVEFLKMNERIQELAEESKEVSHWLDGGYTPVYRTNLEKFAELIIKETLEVARAGIEYGDGMEDAVYRYFGVE